MHNAPPVAFPVGRLIPATTYHLFAAAFSPDGLRVATAAWAPCQHASGGRLFWTGESWFWQAEHELSAQAQAVRLTVGLDTGSGLLMWVQSVDDQGSVMGPLTSAWLQADAMPSKWHGFRCAVYSRPKVQGVKKAPGLAAMSPP